MRTGHARRPLGPVVVDYGSWWATGRRGLPVVVGYGWGGRTGGCACGGMKVVGLVLVGAVAAVMALVVGLVVVVAAVVSSPAANACGVSPGAVDPALVAAIGEALGSGEGPGLAEAGLHAPGEQLANAQVIVQVGVEMGVPPRGLVVALATAMGESRLINVDYGDRDSLGLFQQRPSQGWGTEEQVQDPVHASKRFYEGLLAVPGWEQMRITEAAQAVQRSAFPEGYAPWETLATAIVTVLTGPAGVLAGGGVGSVLVVGDSLGVGALAGGLEESLGTPVTADVQVGRTAAQVPGQVVAAGGGFGTVIVFAGTNPTGVGGVGGFAEAIDATILSAGGASVWWVTLDPTSIAHATAANEVLSEAARRHSGRLRLVDWGGHVSRAPDPDVLRGVDGLHPSPIGYQELAALVGRVVKGTGLSGCGAGHPGAGVLEDGSAAFPSPVELVSDPSVLWKGHHSNPAWDLPMPVGTPIFAPTAGRVVSVTSDGRCGGGVIIDDVAGARWTLCHASRVHVAAGEDVVAGTLVMDSGNTGRSTGPHLHVQVTAGGRLRCPQAWLAAVWAGEQPPAVADLPTSGCVSGSL